MSIIIDFSPEVEAALARRAEAVGKDLPTFIREYLTERLAGNATKPERKKLTPEEFMARVDRMIERHRPVTGFIDDSRESIYAGRGE